VDATNNEELLRIHMNRIGYNKLKELERELAQQRFNNEHMDEFFQ
jgi:hypothetical protein